MASDRHTQLVVERVFNDFSLTSISLDKRIIPYYTYACVVAKLKNIVNINIAQNNYIYVSHFRKYIKYNIQLTIE